MFQAARGSPFQLKRRNICIEFVSCGKRRGGVGCKETMAEGLIQDETSNVTASKGGGKILGVNSQGNLPMQIRMLPVLLDPV